MMAKNSIVEATRLLLQNSAKVYYRGLSEDAKAAVRQSFFAADTRGEGRISFHDFFDSADSAALPGFSWKGLFRFLDADNNGFLELDEFITLYYINESGVFFCSACGIPIITGGFSCAECPPPGRDSFDVCLSCYASPMPAFRHHHPRASFVNLVASYHQSGSNRNSFNSATPSDNSTMRRQAAQIDESGSTFKCDCCGTYIVTDRYTCKECVGSFDLCLSCYDSRPSYLRHPHPYSSFLRRACSQASAVAATRAAEMAAVNEDMVMNARMAAAALNTEMMAAATNAKAMAAMNAEVMAAAMLSANMQAANAMNANYMATLGQLNQGQPANSAPRPAQGSGTLINSGIDLIGQLVGLSLQAGLFSG